MEFRAVKKSELDGPRSLGKESYGAQHSGHTVPARHSRARRTERIETKQQAATRKLKTCVENTAALLFREDEQIDSSPHQVKEAQINPSEF